MVLSVYADSIADGTCRSCGARIVWAQLVNSRKSMPFDGPLAIVTRTGTDVVVVDAAMSPSHFATCPDAGKWRHR